MLINSDGVECIRDPNGISTLVEDSETKEQFFAVASVVLGEAEAPEASDASAAATAQQLAPRTMRGPAKSVQVNL